MKPQTPDTEFVIVANHPALAGDVAGHPVLPGAGLLSPVMQAADALGMSGRRAEVALRQPPSPLFLATLRLRV